MEIITKENIQSLKFPLQIYETIKIGEVTSKNGEIFSIFAGLNEEMVAQLKTLSLNENDIELQKNTSDKKRFGEGPYEDWYKKNRTPFVLVHNGTNALAALIWFGPKPLGRKSLKHLSNEELKENEAELDSKNWHTISYRCYPAFRGKGLMKSFGNFTIDLYLKKFPGINIWASANEENMAGIAYATSLGFKLAEEACDRKADWLVMIRG
jgi:hypothetical protein